MYKLALNRPISTLMFYSGLVILGLVSLFKLNLTLLPHIDYPELAVVIKWKGALPSKIDQEVVKIIQPELYDLPNLKRIYSFSTYGLAIITLQFHWGTNMDITFLLLKEKIDNLKDRLYFVDDIYIKEISPSQKPFIGVIFPYSYKEFVENFLKNRLESIDGVAKVEIFSEQKENHLFVNLNKLYAINSDFGDLKNFLNSIFKEFSGGRIKIGERVFPVRISFKPKDLDEFFKIKFNGLELGDILHFSGGSFSLAFGRGGDEVVMLIYTVPFASPIKVSKKVKDILKNYKCQIFFDKSKFIEDSINSLFLALILGMCLSMLSIFIFIGDWKISIAVVLSMPLSILISIFLFYIFGVSLNLMTLGGLILGVGMVVDNSIVVLESMVRYDKFEKGIKEVASAITASTLTTIAVFLPIIFVYGYIGKIIKPLALSVIFSLLSSLLISLTFTPAMLKILKIRKFEYPSWYLKVQFFYENLISRIFPYKKYVYLSALILFLFSLILFYFLPKEVFPKYSTGKLKVRIFKVSFGNDLEFRDKVKLILNSLNFPYVVVKDKVFPYYDIYMWNVKNYEKIENFMKNSFKDVSSIEFEDYENVGEDFLNFRPKFFEFPEIKYLKWKPNYLNIVRFKLNIREILDYVEFKLNGYKLQGFSGKEIILKPDENSEVFIKIKNSFYPVEIFFEKDFDIEKGSIFRVQGKISKIFSPEKYELKKSFTSLLIALFISILLIYMVIASQFESLTFPFLIMFSLPFATTGVSPFLYIFGKSFNSMSFIGLIILMGIAVNDAIILLDYIEKIKGKYPFEKVPVEAGKRRLRPILMTSITTILALVPVSFGIGFGSKIESPLAVTVMGGLLTSTLLTLILLPLLWYSFKKQK